MACQLGCSRSKPQAFLICVRDLAPPSRVVIPLHRRPCPSLSLALSLFSFPRRPSNPLFEGVDTLLTAPQPPSLDVPSTSQHVPPAATPPFPPHLRCTATTPSRLPPTTTTTPSLPPSIRFPPSLSSSTLRPSPQLVPATPAHSHAPAMQETQCQHGRHAPSAVSGRHAMGAPVRLRRRRLTLSTRAGPMRTGRQRHGAGVPLSRVPPVSSTAVRQAAGRWGGGGGRDSLSLPSVHALPTDCMVREFPRRKCARPLTLRLSIGTCFPS